MELLACLLSATSEIQLQTFESVYINISEIETSLRGGLSLPCLAQITNLFPLTAELHERKTKAKDCGNHKSEKILKVQHSAKVWNIGEAVGMS